MQMLLHLCTPCAKITAFDKSYTQFERLYMTIVQQLMEARTASTVAPGMTCFCASIPGAV